MSHSDRVLSAAFAVLSHHFSDAPWNYATRDISDETGSGTFTVDVGPLSMRFAVDGVGCLPRMTGASLLDIEFSGDEMADFREVYRAIRDACDDRFKTRTQDEVRASVALLASSLFDRETFAVAHFVAAEPWADAGAMITRIETQASADGGR